MARRFKLATALNLIGLIVAFATFFLLAPQIYDQFTYNHDLKDYERLYRMESNYSYSGNAFSDNVCRAFTDVLDSMANVESYSLSEHIHVQNSYAGPSKFIKGDSVLEYTFTQGNNTVVSSLTDRRVDGKIEWTDSDRSGIIIPASIAQEYFGTTQAAGKTMFYYDTYYKDTTEYTVQGVYEDFSKNNEAWNCIYRNINTFDRLSLYTNYRCIVKFKQQFPKDSDEINKWTDSYKKAIINTLKSDPATREDTVSLNENIRDVAATSFKFTPLKNSYFDHTPYTNGERGFKPFTVIFALMCLIVIIIATINFTNFTLAESPMRVRSLNTRLVLGAERHTLRVGLVAECVIVSLAACIIAIGICILLNKLQASSLLIDDSMALGDYKTLTLISVTLAIAVLVGIIAGTYPAVFATSFPPVIALKGSFGLTPQGRKLLTALVGFQLFVSLLMVSYIGILFLQRNYIYNMDYGFDKDQILTTTLPTSIAYDNDSIEKLRQEMMDLPFVTNVAFSNTPLGTTNSQYVVRLTSQGHPIGYRFINTDTDYMRTMGISIDTIQGRDFNKEDTIAAIINEVALRQWSWLEVGDSIPILIYSTDSVPIVGVCKNIHFATTLIDNNLPFAFIVYPNMPLNTMNVRIDSKSDNTDKKHIRQQVNEQIHKVFNEVEDVVFIDDKLSETHKSELQYFKIFNILNFICLVVTLIGIFCMTMFETEYRRKEIGIRKVAGATTREIVWMLCRRYGWLILLCFAAAVPFALFIGHKTLDYFAQRAVIKWWIFPLSLLFVSAIMLGTVALRGWRTARENPTESIKTE